MSYQAGLSLLEVMVTLVLITATTALVASAFPVVREQQALEQARQQFTAAVRAAQTQALDEHRTPDCLSRLGTAIAQQKLCSDIGVAILGNELHTFADIHDNNQFDHDDADMHITSLPPGITVVSPGSILFEATPPNLTAYFNGQVVSPAQPVTITLRSPHRELSLTISAYGLVE